LSASACPSTTGAPAPAAVQRSIADLVRTRRIPGLAVAVTDRERLLYTHVTGLADIGARITVEPTTAWLWFSMSKVVTATAAMRLADHGLLDLDAPYLQYLSEPDRYPQPAEARDTTVRQLLSHTAGIGNPLPLRWVRPADQAPGDDELLDRMLPEALRRTPRSRAAYTNVGYLILGRVIETAAGEPFRQHIERNVLAPTGMTSTGYGYDGHGPSATGYVRAPRLLDPLLRAVLPAGIVDRRHGRQLALRPFLVQGAAYGGLVGPVTDVARFVRLHLDDGEIDGTRVITAATARAMREVTWPGKPFDHGLGWFRKPTGDPDRSPYVEHYGAGAGFWNAMRLYPEQGLGMAVMANTTQPYDIDTLFETIRTEGTS
jgi:CubicO group peptidase (beta-lactamase class C family)